MATSAPAKTRVRGQASQMLSAEVIRSIAAREHGLHPLSKHRIARLRLNPFKPKSGLYYVFTVIVRYEGERPEPFGTVSLETAPRVGQVIQLYWLDGKRADRVKVTLRDGMTIHAEPARKG